MSWQAIKLEKTAGRAIITLNRPDRLNAINLAMGAELREVIREVDLDRAVRVVIITGAGRGFCSGADVVIDEEREPGEWLELLNDVIRRIRLLRKPAIGAVNGAAVGAGFSVAMACDVRYAAEEARFSSIFVRRALSVDCGLSYTLPRVIGLSNALQLMYSGEIIDAAKAEKLGIVSKVVPAGQLMEACDDLAAIIVNGPPIAIASIRRVVYHAQDTGLEAALDMERLTNNTLMFTEDYKEGVTAFREKRQAIFKGK